MMDDAAYRSAQEVQNGTQQKSPHKLHAAVSSKTRLLIVAIVGTVVVGFIIVCVILVLQDLTANTKLSPNTSAVAEDCWFLCDANRTCLNATSVCDNKVDCFDSTDESECPSTEATKVVCLNGAFICHVDNTCITSSKLCNNQTDCSDGSDEINCRNTNNTTSLNVTNLIFTCPDSTKISFAKVCDSVEDCVGGRDEEKCARSVSGTAQDVQLFNAISNDFVSICSEGWDEEKSKLMCQFLGFDEVQSTNYVPYTGDMVTVSGNSFSDWVNSEVYCNATTRLKLQCKPNSCGVTYQGKIVGGVNAKIEKNPWQISIQRTYNDGSTYSHICGGVIIGHSIILTAGHCLYKSSLSKLQILVGTDTLSSGGTRYNLHSFVIHPEYDDASLNADIAIIKTATSMDLSIDQVNTVCLPAPGQQFADEETVKVTGWGSLMEASNSNSNILQKVEVKIVNFEICKESYSSLTEYNVCAGLINGGKDACQGDSGGPLTHRVNNIEYTLVGLVSSGKGCARANYPGVYTEVAEFISWIRKYNAA